MIHIQPGIYVTINQMSGNHAPRPFPLESGFSEGRLYLVLGVADYSESSESYFILANDRSEPWFISNRHLRIAHAKHPLWLDKGEAAW